MRFSVTFCALLLVTTTGIARADSSKPVKTTGKNQADSSKPVKTTGKNQADSIDNVVAAAFDGLNWTMWGLGGFSLEKGEGGKGVAIAAMTAEQNNIRPSTDPKNPGQIATNLGYGGSSTDKQLFVGTPDRNSQSVMVSYLDSEGNTLATFVSLNPATNKLISATDCAPRPGEKKPLCLTITKKICDAIFPKPHQIEQKLKKIEECGELLHTIDALRDRSVVNANVARMKSIRPGLRLTANQNAAPDDSIRELSQSYDSLARAISVCHRAGPFERLEDPVKARNSQGQNKSSGLSEEAK